MKDYVYMVRCADGSLYTGWTNHLLEREEAHSSGKGARYTRSRGPVKLAYAKAFSSPEEARKAEAALKQLNKEQKEALVSGMGEDWRPGRIYYIMGKSASGKNKIYDRLLSDEGLGLCSVVIYTTRPRRKGEQDGVEYHFCDDDTLKKLTGEGRVIECRAYNTVHGIWKYFTADDESIDLTTRSYIGIGTLESYKKLRRYFGELTVAPIYVETDDGIRLERALKREHKQPDPKYDEMCRRFLADQKDFGEDKLVGAGIEKRFSNNSSLEECIENIRDHIVWMQKQ